ncbi:hypothetical protein RIVM261_059080 [Rivularia sp. IAM M-261]|nr:hypothetical protein RIVM261_059080 [Rivularia sp. IAM M-261]
MDFIGKYLLDIIITDWALQSYLDLKHKNTFTSEEYKNIIRPDVILLKEGFPPENPKFQNGKFWSFATLGNSTIKDGYKMKWHNTGQGKVQLRLGVAVLSDFFLCRGYVKSNENVDKREMAKLKINIRDISKGNFSYRGML